MPKPEDKLDHAGKAVVAEAPMEAERQIRHLQEAVRRLTLAVDWYEERCRELANPKRSANYDEAVTHELTLDGGQRARAALEPHAPRCIHCTWDRGSLVRIDHRCPVHSDERYRPMEEAPKDGTPVYLEFGPVDVAAFWDLELGWVTTREYTVSRIGKPNRWRPYGRQ